MKCIKLGYELLRVDNEKKSQRGSGDFLLSP